MSERDYDIFELAPDGIVITDIDGVISAVNSAVLSLSGYSKDELVGEYISNLITLEEEDIQRKIKLFLSSPEYGPKPFIFSMKHKDGDKIWVEAHIGMINVGTGKENVCIILRDITDRKRVEEELLFKNTLLEAQYETSPDGILVLNQEGKAILFNKRFGDMWGIPQGVLNTRSSIRLIWRLLNCIHEPIEFMKIVKFLDKNPNEKIQDEIELKDGRTFERYSCPLIDSNNKHHGRIWFFRDITERKRYERKLE
ncbi:MAG: PAS domain-containing protein, partial [Candidatus Bathyarchaeia archaeon]